VTSVPWEGDAVGLVEAYRRGDADPSDVVGAALDAITSSGLNAFCHLVADEALAAAKQVDRSLPLAGVPLAVKETEAVAGWPLPDGSTVLRHRVAGRTSTNVARLLAAGAIPVGQTTSAEMARAAYTSTRLHGVTRNPWDPGRTPGGSSGGSAAAVAGGLVPIATATDGGGSTRQPAALCGLPGLKVTWRLIPAGPSPIIEPLTVVVTPMTRSVRDLARMLDVTAGFDARDPFSLRVSPAFEARLGASEAGGLTVAFWPGFAGASADGSICDLAEQALTELSSACRLRRVPAPDVKLTPPDDRFSAAAALRLRRWLGHAWPECAAELSPEVREGMVTAHPINVDALAHVDDFRNEAIDAIARIFGQIDLIATPTVGYEAFAAAGPPPTTGNDLWPANVTGCPAISIPIGAGPGGLPIGLQLVGPHDADQLLLDLAYRFEQVHPWPLVARPVTA
jgi:Asp-tRNA(Asn)/Glu-tRNA(Gln) amidotransferase A subunit family amidase